MDKIINWIKQNKELAIIGLIIFVFLLLIISALIPNKKGSGVELIEQPLYFYENRRITLKDEAYKEFKYPKKGLEIYKIKDENQNIKVEGLITLLNIPAPKKSNISNFLYEWKNKGGDLVQYDVKSQSVTIILQNRIDLFPNIAAPSDSQLNTFLTTFVSKYLGYDYKYLDTNLTRGNGEIKIEGRRDINGYALQTPGSKKYSDYIILDENLKLKSANILLVQFETKASDKLTIIKPSEVNSISSRNDYPREINQGLPEGLPEMKPTYSKDYSDDFGLLIPKVASMEMDSIEIVYLYSNVDQKFITPVYRMNGSGKIILSGQTYNVPMVAHLSIIDPDHVYVPSNIIYSN